MPEYQKIDSSIIKKLFPPRDSEGHKNDHGHLLVIGGSKLYSGSPALNALAAYKVGVDLVTVAAPKRVADIVATYSPNLITYPIDDDTIDRSHLDEILELIKGKSALVIGGGLGRKEENLDFVREILKVENLPIVLDADAIYAVMGHEDLLKERKFVLTPHGYEFQVLTGRVVPTELGAKAQAVQQWAIDLCSTIVFKGKTDIISDGQNIMFNETGNPFMTVGGTGDTLAGIYGGLLAQRKEEFLAGCGAAYINGAAGDLAAAQLGPGLTATDLLDHIPQVIMEVLAV